MRFNYNDSLRQDIFKHYIKTRNIKRLTNCISKFSVYLPLQVILIAQHIKNKKMMTDKPYAIGVDIGGTNTVFGIVDKRGQILKNGSVKTGTHPNIEGFLDDLTKALEKLIEEVGTKEEVMGIGVGAPNGNYFSGCIEFAPNLRWKGVIPLVELLEERIGIPVVLTNDANAAAIGEMTYGAARGMKDFIVITLGTGVGSGVVANGELIYGDDGFAGELGHIIMRRTNGRLCGCGRSGCLEAYSSATGDRKSVV